jgi:hypothetical protein
VSEPESIRQSEEGINLRLLIKVGVFSMTIALASVLLVYGILRARGDIGGQPQPRPHGRAGLILQNLIESPRHPGYSAEAGALDDYGWVDDEREFAQIPIERAMEIIAERGR